MKQRSHLQAIVLAVGGAAVLSACVIAPVRPPEPAPRVEVITAAPGPGAHWVKGHYRWAHHEWEWIPGHWQAPAYAY